MRTGQYRRCPRVSSLEAAEDIADRIDSNIQPGLAHEMDQYLAAAQFLNRKYQPRHRAAIADADTSDGVQITHEAAPVDGDAVSRPCPLGFPLHSRKRIVSVFIEGDNGTVRNPFIAVERLEHFEQSAVLNLISTPLSFFPVLAPSHFAFFSYTLPCHGPIGPI
jgi:hypothetical protein